MSCHVLPHAVLSSLHLSLYVSHKGSRAYVMCLPLCRAGGTRRRRLKYKLFCTPPAAPCPFAAAPSLLAPRHPQHLPAPEALAVVAISLKALLPARFRSITCVPVPPKRLKSRPPGHFPGLSVRRRATPGEEFQVEVSKAFNGISFLPVNMFSRCLTRNQSGPKGAKPRHHALRHLRERDLNKR